MPQPARRSLLAASLVALLAAGCDDTFTPLDPSDLNFSVFGFLDAAADTQWVRVMPLRALVLTTPEPLDARVTLQNVRTGRVIELRDSVFRFGAGGQAGSAGRFLHNFWTTERLEPGASYRFSAAREGEAPSEAEVTLPTDFQTEVWIDQRLPPGRDSLWLGGVRHIALATRVSHFHDGCGSAVDRVVIPVTPADADVQTIAVSPQIAARPGCGQPTVEKRELVVTGSGAPWPRGREYQTSRLGTPDDSSSISGAVGFLGGVLTKTVPYETCVLLVAGPPTAPCKLRYDAASATLVGRAKDVTCDGAPVSGVLVRLEEMAGAGNGPPKLRPVTGTRGGEFTIGALEAGKRYVLTLRRPHPVFGNEQYQEYADTLRFTPGERRAYEARMIRVEPCPTP